MRQVNFLFIVTFMMVAGLSHLSYARDTIPLPVAEASGRGPFALPNVNHHVMGAVNVYGGEQPDLFVAGYGGPRALWLARWTDTCDRTGVPVFDTPVRVPSPFNQRASILQIDSGEILAFWLDGQNVVLGYFDKEDLRFRETRRWSPGVFPRAPQGVSAFANKDGSFDLVFEILDGVSLGNAARWDEDWKPYDGMGVWTGGKPYSYLYSAQLNSREAERLEGFQQATASQREVFIRMYRTAPVKLNADGYVNLISGSRMGNFHFFRRIQSSDGKLRFHKRMLVPEAGGLAVRTPQSSVGVIAYPDPETGFSHLIAGGEGALQFYRFTGEFNRYQVPIYAGPNPVLQENADLYGGSLPVPSVVDWNGDGLLDIVSGNSEGRVLFFQNMGTNEAPEFANGVPLYAGGQEIVVQAGYSGSVQGISEARWGYTSPNVVDWNGNGVPDIVMGDITGNYTVYLNRGTATQPKLDAAVPLFSDGLNLRGKWRVRPGVARIDGYTALITVDTDDNLHLYWRIDDQNVESAGILKLKDGSPITVSSGFGGMVGRCKISIFDWDGDGKKDLVISTARHNAIPNQETGFPKPTLGDRPLGTVLFLRNVGTNMEPVYEHTVPFVHRTLGVLQPGGAHESGTVPAHLGPNGPNLLGANETGRFFLYLRENLSTRWPAQ